MLENDTKKDEQRVMRADLNGRLCKFACEGTLSEVMALVAKDALQLKFQREWFNWGSYDDKGKGPFWWYDCSPKMQEDLKKSSPLHAAAENGHLDVVNFLLAGMPINYYSKVSVNTSPFAVARANGHRKVAEVLLKVELEVYKSEFEQLFYSTEFEDKSRRGFLMTLSNHARTAETGVSYKEFQGAVVCYCDYLRKIMYEPSLVQLGCDHAFGILMKEVDRILYVRTIIADITACEPRESITYEDFHVALDMVASEGDLWSLQALNNWMKCEIEKGSTALRPTFEAAHDELVQVLINARANLNTAYFDVFSAFEPNAGDGKISELLPDGYTQRYSDIWELAIREGLVEVVNTLVKRGADVNKPLSDGMTPLEVSVEADNYRLTSVLLKANALVNEKNKDGETLLHMAIWAGCIPIVALLIDHGADVNVYAGERELCTPLQCAISTDRERLVMMLLEAGADVNATREPNKLPLLLALDTAIKRSAIYIPENQDNFIFDCLLLSGAEIPGDQEILAWRDDAEQLEKLRNSRMLPAVLNIVKKDMDEKDFGVVVDYLQKRIDDWDEFLDSIQGHIDDINGDHKFRSLFKEIIKIRNLKSVVGRELARMILKTFPNLKNQDFINRGLIMGMQTRDCQGEPGAGLPDVPEEVLRHMMGYISVTEVMLLPDALRYIKQGLNIQQVNKGIKAAGARGSLCTFLRAGLNVNHVDPAGKTLLHSAVFHKKVDNVALLIECGADVNKVDERGMTPLMVAIAKGDLGVFEMLITAGADINACNKDGETLLHIAAKQRNLPMLQRFIDRGADVHHRDNQHRTPLDVAAEMGSLKIAQALREMPTTKSTSLEQAEGEGEDVSRGEGAYPLSSAHATASREPIVSSIKIWTPQSI